MNVSVENIIAIIQCLHTIHPFVLHVILAVVMKVKTSQFYLTMKIEPKALSKQTYN